jgi:hypothetical protein
MPIDWYALALEGMLTYVSVATWGSYEDHGTNTLYAGPNYTQAKHVLEDFTFPDEWNNWGWIEAWYNGIKAPTIKYVRE